ncbi:MAG: hypothetical protein HC898_02130 [Phycisphaerales bacterium]|nr:hypothetical protein [Phycisphaerales bacterium]
MQMKINQLRITPSADLPQRIAQVLRSQTDQCCEMRGQARLRLTQQSSLIHKDTQPVQRLTRQAEPEEFCESIDRY